MDGDGREIARASPITSRPKRRASPARPARKLRIDWVPRPSRTDPPRQSRGQRIGRDSTDHGRSGFRRDRGQTFRRSARQTTAITAAQGGQSGQSAFGSASGKSRSCIQPGRPAATGPAVGSTDELETHAEYCGFVLCTRRPSPVARCWGLRFSRACRGWRLRRCQAGRHRRGSAADRTRIRRCGDRRERRAFRELQLSGTLSPWSRPRSAPVSGEMLEMTVREGQVCIAATCSRASIRATSCAARQPGCEPAKARADLQLAKLNRDNSEQLLAEHFISQKAYDSANSTYQASVASENWRKAQCAWPRLSVDDSVVHAPFNGHRRTASVQPGEKVSPDTALFQLVDLTLMEWKLRLPPPRFPACTPADRAFHRRRIPAPQFRRACAAHQSRCEVNSRSSRFIWPCPMPMARCVRHVAQGVLTLDKSGTQPVIPRSAVR